MTVTLVEMKPAARYDVTKTLIPERCVFFVFSMILTTKRDFYPKQQKISASNGD